jgi:hypothetical protein
LLERAVSNGIRHDDEVLADIEWLAFGEQEIGSTRLQELPASAGRPMQHQDTIAAVGSQNSERSVVQSNVECPTFGELEARRGIGRGAGLFEPVHDRSPQ